MVKNKEKLRNILIVVLIIIMSIIMLFYQSKKIGFHEDEMYTIASSINPYDGVMSAYGEKDNQTIMLEKYVSNDNIFIEIKNAIHYVLHQDEYSEEMGELYKNQKPEWKTRDDVQKYMTLSKENYLNFKSIYYNQTKDNHPPFFYTLVHISSIFFNGQFTKYTVFVVNIIAFILSCFVIKGIFKVINKENLTIPTLIFFGLAMGTITMVIYQRMYMLLTFFILLYFYLSLKIYKNDFKLRPKMNIALGVTTVLGFLTQYFFAIYAFFICFIMVIKMAKDKKYKEIIKYIGFHILYAIIGVLLFVPCIDHLLFSDRGVSNLGNSEYFKHAKQYIEFLLFSFTIKNNMIIASVLLVLLFAGIVYMYNKSNQKFIILISTIPSICYFFIAVKLTSFQELRYVMPMLPFISITLFLILDNIFKFKYKNIVFIAMATLVIINGIVFSNPKFLFSEYKESLDVAEQNKDKCFVFVYDNFFNHIQDIPEMMIYKKSIIINTSREEEKYFIEDKDLNNEDSFILCIKTYMDNDKIINELKEKTEFKNFTRLYSGGNSHEVISNNLYMVAK